MNALSRVYLRIVERRGQGMTEYALILAAVAVAAFVTYEALGTAIVGVLNTVIAGL